MRVVVTGSRDWTDVGVIRAALAELPSQSIIIHGGARGADTLAGSVALSLDFRVIRVAARWGVYGKAAGSIRNQEMIDMKPGLVLAFPMKGSIGTWDCVNKAKKAGIRVKVIR